MSGLDITRFVSIFGIGIVAGTMVTVLAAFIPIVGAVGDRDAVYIRQRMNVAIDRYQRLASGLATLAGIVSFAFSLTTAGYVLNAVGVAGAIGVGVVSLGFNVPINKKIDSWSIDAVPPEFRAMQERWNRLHVIRTVLSLVALAGFTASALTG